jgi:hypothetical protein
MKRWATVRRTLTKSEALGASEREALTLGLASAATFMVFGCIVLAALIVDEQSRTPVGYGAASSAFMWAFVALVYTKKVWPG